MPRTATLAILASLAFSSAAGAQSISEQFENRCFPVYAGGTPDPWSAGYCAGYLFATFNALLAQHEICPGGKPTVPQLKLIIDKAIVEHAELLNRPVSKLMVDAFVRAWPCEKLEIRSKR